MAARSPRGGLRRGHGRLHPRRGAAAHGARARAAARRCLEHAATERAAGIRVAFVRVAVTGASVWAVVALFFAVVPSFATERIGIGNLAALGAISSIVLICSSISQVASPGSVEPHLAQALGLGLLTAGLAALVLASVTDNAIVLVAASVLAGTGHGLGFLGAQDNLNRIAPPERRGESTPRSTPASMSGSRSRSSESACSPTSRRSPPRSSSSRS